MNYISYCSKFLKIKLHLLLLALLVLSSCGGIDGINGGSGANGKARQGVADGANGGGGTNGEARRGVADGANGGGGANGEARQGVADGANGGGGANGEAGQGVADGTNGGGGTNGAKPGDRWSGRLGHQVVLKDGSFYLFGGLSGDGSKNDVWSSRDGISWTEVLPDGEESENQWERRYGHQVVIKGDYFFLFGGNAKEYKNDVWKSHDGIKWEEVTAGAPWTARTEHQVVLKGEEFYLFGGYGSNVEYKNDVWKWDGEDGTDWEEVAAGAPWTTRASHQVVLKGEEFYLFGGKSWSDNYKNDVWKWDGEDGTDWEEVTAGATWPGRDEHQVILKDGSFYLFGGRADKDYKNDVWKWDGEDGTDWSLKSREGAPWKGRLGHQIILKDGSFYLFGGEGSSDSYKNDVWKWDETTWTKLENK